MDFSIINDLCTKGLFLTHISYTAYLFVCIFPSEKSYKDILKDNGYTLSKDSNDIEIYLCCSKPIISVIHIELVGV